MAIGEIPRELEVPGLVVLPLRKDHCDEQEQTEEWQEEEDGMGDRESEATPRRALRSDAASPDAQREVGHRLSVMTADTAGALRPPGALERAGT